MAYWTYQVVAATTISSVIEASPLSTGASISSLIAGETFTTSTQTILGSCPTNSYVKLVINGNFEGVAWCQSDQTFSITASLYAGSNVITAEDFNTTDMQGPSTPSIQVTYRAPAAVVSPINNGSARNDATKNSAGVPSTLNTLPPSLLLGSEFQFKSFHINETFSWQAVIEGGTPPYTVHVDWGDGSNTALYFNTESTFMLTDTYTNSGYYAVVLTSNDSNGQQRVLQLAALITDKNGNIIPAVTTTPPGGNILTRLLLGREQLVFSWTAYIVVILMSISFWLGSEHEFQHLQSRPARSARKT